MMKLSEQLAEIMETGDGSTLLDFITHNHTELISLLKAGEACGAEESDLHDDFYEDAEEDEEE